MTLTTLTARAAGALAVILALAAPVAAQTAAPPAYSATALHTLPDGTVNSGLVVKSGPDMRMEYTENGQKVIQIIRRAEGAMYLLDPAAQSFFELRGAPPADPGGVGYLPPCQEGDPSMICTFAGTEVTSGITAEVWDIAMPGADGAMRILWDGARHRALQQTYPDGSQMKMTFKAMVDLSGRMVEHWTIQAVSPGQPVQAGEWFYDPELRVEIREVMPSGESRSLEDIVVGPVDPALFAVPQGWTRRDMPAPPPGAN
jgi:hypothetical protein